MVEEIIQTIKQAMMPDLTDAQMEKLEMCMLSVILDHSEKMCSKSV